MPGGQTRRVVLHGHSHNTGDHELGAGLRPAARVLDIGDSFAFWLGSDRARGVVTRRLFV
jgi:hypothetical protein